MGWILWSTDNTNEEDEDSTTATTTDDDEEEEPTHAAYHNLQTCLSDVGGEGFPTEQEVQDCMELSYSGIDSNESKPTESTDEDENGVNEDASTDDTEDEDSEE